MQFGAAEIDFLQIGHAAAEDLSDVIVETVSSQVDRHILHVFKKICHTLRISRRQVAARMDISRVAFFITCFSKQQIKDCNRLQCSFAVTHQKAPDDNVKNIVKLCINYGFFRIFK